MYAVKKRSNYNWINFADARDTFKDDICGLMENQNGREIDYFEK
jgi:hypothetical protein